MKRILYLGMDVHNTNYTLCCLEPVFGMADDKIFGITQVAPDWKNIEKYITAMKKKLGDNEIEFICGYEAGYLGYSLYHQLKDAGISCIILAPSTMMTTQGKRIKTDPRDAIMISRCLAYGTYSSVYIPTEIDESVKEYIRMRDDHKIALKKIKQQIIAFCSRHGFRYPGKTNWTAKHLKWLDDLQLGNDILKLSLEEYLITYRNLTDKIETMDNRIQEFADSEAYAEDVKKLICLLGVKTPTALSAIVETGDFSRFKKGNVYAAFLGLAPGEQSSGDRINRGGISKTGNSHLRKLFIEAAQGICKGKVGQKSKALKARQAGAPSQIIAYADKANERMRRKYYRLISKGKKKNVAVTAVARELACFIWGMMTNNIGDVKPA